MTASAKLGHMTWVRLAGFRSNMLNVILRATTLASKFLLLVYLARVLPPEQLGVYGIFTATVSYALYLLGLDFYAYAQREMLDKPREAWGGVIRDQFIFYGLAYLGILPLLLLVVFASGSLPWSLLGWFFLILSLEHLSQELYRLLVITQKHALAGWVLFLRTGAWVYLSLALIWAVPDLQNLASVWMGWVFGAGASVAVALYGLREFRIGSQKEQPIHWAWMKKGVLVGMKFLLGTLALRGMFTFDRYILDWTWGKEQVGVYTFYMGIASAALSFIDAGIIMQVYPKIMHAIQSHDVQAYHKAMKELSLGMVLIGTAILIAVWLFIGPVINFVGHPAYQSSIGTLWALLAAILAYCFALIPHYPLYARRYDRVILGANLVGFLVFSLAAIWFVKAFSGFGVALAMFLGMVSIGVVKSAVLLRCPVEHK
ncbi:oligosaccharide flippase family protein [Thermithiobacillus tepidarius DSM 3134]|uniref:lipopolysaccharide biosynthesis protein n=1 Tax=Thermithiobacillus tepidarius TaxID=929 RepID=UPI0012DC6AB4|nr:oligosaccharide flippase family protein [Thermithiobacillus tepidarius]